MTIDSSPPPTTSEPQILTPLCFDWREHQDLLDSDELSEDERREFLETLWAIMVHFVDMGFEINPLQLLCEQNEENSSVESPYVVNSKQNQPTQLIDENADRVKTDAADMEDS